MRHRMRAIQLKHLKRAKTIDPELLARKTSSDVAAQVAANARRWWRNSGTFLNSVLNLAWASRLGIPRLCWPQLLEPPGPDPHAGWCGRGGRPLPLCRFSLAGKRRKRHSGISIWSCVCAGLRLIPATSHPLGGDGKVGWKGIPGISYD